MTKINVSNEYDKFQLLLGNRGETKDQRHLNLLRESIKEKNLLDIRPILVNEDFCIIDGHTRFAICQEMNLPIYYIQKNGLGYEDAVRLTRGTTEWSVQEYCEGYALNDNPEYQKLVNFLKKYDLNITHFLALSHSNYRSKSPHDEMKKGNFIFKKEYEKLGPVIEKIHEFKSIVKENEFPLSFFSSNNIWIALHHFIKFPETDWEWFLQAFPKNKTKFKKCVSWKEYFMMFCDIYNYAKRGKIPKIDREVVHLIGK